MKILFPVPPYYQTYSNIPYGIGIVATVAKQAGLDVQLFVWNEDENIDDFNERLIQEVKAQNIDVVAMGGQSPAYPHIKKCIDMLRANTNVIIVLGGYIVDATPEIVAKNIGADYCVVGEGEFTFVALIQALQNNEEIQEVAGLIYMKDGELITTPSRPCVASLDVLPPLNGELCHFQTLLHRNPTLFLNLSRSCPYQCTFCYHLKDSPYRAKSLDQVFEELDYYIADYGHLIKRLNIQDELLSATKARMLEFCRRIEKYNLPFVVMGARVDTTDEEMLIALKKAGATLITYGLESADNRILSSMKKKTTIEQAEKTLEFTVKHGMQINAGLIIGDIEDDSESVRKSEEFYLKYAHKYNLYIVPIHVLPNSRLYKYALEKGIIKDELEFLQNGCPYVNVSKLSDDEYDLLFDKHLWQGYSLLKKVMLRPLENRDLLQISLNKNGEIDSYTCYCSSCNHKMLFENINPYVTNLDFFHPYDCPKCNQLIDLSFAKTFSLSNADVNLLKNLSELYFSQYAGSRVVIWGVNSSIRKLLFLSQSLRDMVVAIVDKNYTAFEGQYYCGLAVESPDVLKELEFDYVVTPLFQWKNQLVDAMNNMGIHDLQFIMI